MNRAYLVSLTEGVGVALDSLRSNRVRAALTILGVAIGVFVVVAISSFVNGIYESVRRDVDGAGPTTFYLRSSIMNSVQSCDQFDPDCRPPRAPALTAAEADAIRDLPMILGVNAQQSTSATVDYKDIATVENVSVVAADPSWIDVDPGDIEPGRNFSSREADEAAPVVVIDDQLAHTLFGSEPPLERQITLNDVPFRVIGVYQTIANPLRAALQGADRSTIRIPLKAGQRYFGTSRDVRQLVIKPRDGVVVGDATDAVTMLLRIHRGLHPDDPDNFSITTQDALLDQVNTAFGVLFLVMFSLSSIALMVGGVGVVAIMMISVTERTKEIGVRKALGATKGTILWQFLVEAVTLTGVGAIIGLVVGVGLAAAVRTFSPLPTSTPVGAIFAALGMSAFTGVVFGIAPAIRAARLDPVEALRHE